MPFRIVRNDITKMSSDVIVNTANPDVAVGAGTDRAIYEAAGREELLKEREKIGRLAAGEVAATSGGRLLCRYIFHVSGPAYIDGKHNEGALLRLCYEKCLDLAKEYGCASIAFPLLATGCYGFPREEAVNIALEVFGRFLMKEEMDIYLVVFDEESVAVSGKFFPDVVSYVNEHYVETVLDTEYGVESHDVAYEEREGGLGDNTHIIPDGRQLGQTIVYDVGGRNEEPLERKTRSQPFWCGTATSMEGRRPPVRDGKMGLPQPDMTFAQPEKPVAPKKSAARSFSMPFKRQKTRESFARPTEESAMPARTDSLGEFIRRNTGSFAEYLQQLINKKGMTNAEVYKKANLSKQYFYKIMHDQVKPAKEKVLCIAIALQLNLDETVDFLRYAGYALSPYSKTDLVFEYFIKKKEYDIFNIDIALFDLGLPCLAE